MSAYVRSDRPNAQSHPSLHKRYESYQPGAASARDLFCKRKSVGLNLPAVPILPTSPCRPGGQVMNEHRHGKRIRIITDEAKYRRHWRRKLMRLLVRVVVWALVLAIGAALFWLLLDKMQPHAHE